MLPESLQAYALSAQTIASGGTAFSKINFGEYNDTERSYATPFKLQIRPNNTPNGNVDVSIKLMDWVAVEHDSTGGGTQETILPAEVILTVKASRPRNLTQLVSANPFDSAYFLDRIQRLAYVACSGYFPTSTEADRRASLIMRAINGER